jgi:hypothetical protein
MNRIIVYIVFFFVGAGSSQAQIRSESFLIKNGNIELPGTLTYTKTSEDLIIWVHGSGDVDRNGNQASANVKANYVKQFRDAINARDIAFFSYDKRTANPKNAAYLKGVVLDDYVTDVQKVLEYIKEKYPFETVTLVGHSQGSLVAMLASKDVQKIVSLAGPSQRFDEAVIRQIKAQSPPLAEASRAHFKELEETGTIKEVNPMLKTIFAEPNFPILKNWMQYNPSEEIKKISIPILIINGTKDSQVEVADAKALKEAQPEATLVIIDKMNHVLKMVEKDADNVASYYSPDFKISNELIQTVSEFVKK